MVGTRRYIFIWAAGLLVCLGLVAAFTAAVDPYDILGNRRIAGFNARKSAIAAYARFAKAHQVGRVKPHAVMVGTSRVDIGLNPDSPAWPADVRPVYNFGVPGARLTDAYRFMLDADAAGALKTALVMLDFESFFGPDDPDAPDEMADRHLVTADAQPNPQLLWGRVQDFFLSTLTLSALIDSVTTVAAQRQLEGLDLTDRGSTTDGAFRQLVKSDGYFQLFTQKERIHVSVSSRIGPALARTPGPMPGFEMVSRMIAYGRAHNIRMIFVIPPYHADLLDIFDTAGLWDRFEGWKRQLTTLMADSSAGNFQPVLWDFSDYDRYATEDVPAESDRAGKVDWFWEPGHFKKPLGDMILRRVLTDEPSNFGVRLTQADIDAHLAHIRDDRAAYRKAHPAQVARVADLFNQEKRTNP